ncbi:Hypothetical predicted protein [Podarcis lilfordi]|uniref:Uncharacterized protein n=1 Tax=Podarcis lilfordi TaxID=74358 RepID=A0AA35K8S8_9SAUR|nr:Hypothetical predicted protein [Podarcis lilfordi]
MARSWPPLLRSRTDAARSKEPGPARRKQASKRRWCVARPGEKPKRGRLRAADLALPALGAGQSPRPRVELSQIDFRGIDFPARPTLP